jgi:hypothetical protein
MTNSKEAMTVRPFYFVVVVWGQEFRDYFLEYCLPSLLSPKNIPMLDGHRSSKFLMATTREDWDAMRSTAIFRELEKYTEPVFLELPPKGDRPYWLHAIVGHRMCCEMTVRDSAYRILVCPDTVFSEGAVKLFHEVALDGAQVILSLTGPLTRTDQFFKTLSEMGLLPARSARDTGIPIVLPPRQLVASAMRTMHGMFRVNEWEAPYFCRYAAMPWWRVPGELGAVVNGPCWNLFLADYSAARHDGAVLDTRGFDGDYNKRAIGDLETAYLVRDSDEFYVVSWASLPKPSLRCRDGAFGKGIAFRGSAYSPIFNALHRDLLFMPTLVHSGTLGKEWCATEEKALRTMATWLNSPVNLERYSRGLPPSRRNFAGLQARVAAYHLPWWRRNPITWWVICRVITPVARLSVRMNEFFSILSHVGNRIVLASRGDTASIERLRWRGRKFLARALGRPFG